MRPFVARLAARRLTEEENILGGNATIIGMWPRCCGLAMMGTQNNCVRIMVNFVIDGVLFEVGSLGELERLPAQYRRWPYVEMGPVPTYVLP